MVPGRNVRGAWLMAWALVAALAGGCQLPQPEPPRPSVRVDPCAERLHDVCGHLLLYYATHKRLPPSLDALKATGPLPLSPLVCPVSGKPYVYDSRGLAIPDRPGRLVLYDAEPSHSGMRWGIMVKRPEGGAIMTGVTQVTEKEMASATPAPELDGGDR